MIKDSGIIAKRYAEALFNLCLKEKNLEAVEKAFDSFVNETSKNRKFAAFMESPVIPRKSKEDVLAKIMPQDMPQILALFLKLILSKKRFELLHSMGMGKAARSYFGTRSESARPPVTGWWPRTGCITCR